MASKKNKPSKLAQAASRRLQRIGVRELSAQELAHAMYHAEERGEVQRVPTPDGGWAWLLPEQNGERQQLAPTPEVLAWLERFATDPSAHQH